MFLCVLNVVSTIYIDVQNTLKKLTEKASHYFVYLTVQGTDNLNNCNQNDLGGSF